MDTTFFTGALAVILGLIPQPALRPPSEDYDQSRRLSIAEEPWGYCAVPEDLRRAVGVLEDEDTWTSEAFNDYRNAHPELFGNTAPPRRVVRVPGEFSPASTLLLSYQPYDEYDEIFGEIISWSIEQGSVEVIVPRADRRRFEALLRRFEISPSELSINTSLRADTVWIRDWGPQPVVGPDGLEFVDLRFFLNCLDDDAGPTRLAAEMGRRVYRPDLWLEGGNLLSNGAGLCFATNRPLHQQGERRTVERLMEMYLGCEQTVFVEPLVGDVVQHVDMFMSLADEDLVLLGRFEPLQSPENFAILERTAAQLSRVMTLSGRPLRVVRVPMPDPREPQGIEGLGEPLIRSYLNLLPFNGVVLVPVFDEEQTREEAAIEVIQRAFPERAVVPIPVDQMAEDNGTIHCVTKTLPQVQS